MASQNPIATTWGNLLSAALRDCGAVGIGMSPLSEDLLDASERGIQLLQAWERKRWLVYSLATYVVTSTGQGMDSYGNLQPYTVGPAGGPAVAAGGQPLTFPFTAPQIPVGTYGFVSRPNRIESAFFRQFIAAPNGPVDYPLRPYPSLEDYNAIRLKGLTNFSLICYYQPEWPYGFLYVWPWPQAGIYGVGITVREQLPQAFSLNANPLGVVLNLPFEYYRAIRTNVAMEMLPKYGVPLQSALALQGQAKDALETIRRGNTEIPLLDIPPGLYPRPGMYNIFSDQTGPT